MTRTLKYLLIALIVSSSCTLSLDLPKELVMRCSDTEKCPEGYECRCSKSGNEVEACDDAKVSICIKEGNEAFCGNGIVEVGEDCDPGWGTALDQECPYGVQSCILCRASTCQYAEVSGAYCGDGIVQQQGLVGGEDVGGWEGCDPGTLANPTPSVSCSLLHPLLGSGMATCNADCVRYDTSGCENQSVTFVPAGPFMMGCDLEVDQDCNILSEDNDYINLDSPQSPYHSVYLDAYVISKMEITAEDYEACVDAGACTYTGPLTDDDPRFSEEGIRGPATLRNYQREGRSKHPVNFVSLTQAEAFCASLTMSVPTEAQWEKMARGTDSRKYPWGNQTPTCELAIIPMHVLDEGEDGEWVKGCGKDRTWEVGQKPAGASPYGNLDVAGNLWEWTTDWFDDGYYSVSPPANPTGPEGGIYGKTIRGGSWGNSEIQNLRAAFRFFWFPEMEHGYVGFRCANSLESSETPPEQ